MRGRVINKISAFKNRPARALSLRCYCVCLLGGGHALSASFRWCAVGRKRAFFRYNTDDAPAADIFARGRYEHDALAGRKECYGLLHFIADGLLFAHRGQLRRAAIIRRLIYVGDIYIYRARLGQVQMCAFFPARRSLRDLSSIDDATDE